MNFFERAFISLNSRQLLRFIPDKLCLKILYRIHFHQKLNLEQPRTFNEKLQYLKLYDRKAIYQKMVDKYEAKGLVASIIGNQYIIPTYGVYDSFDEIDFAELPNQFVMKCTHNSNGLIICKDKSKLDIDKARKKFSKLLKRNYYWSGREWPYKNIKPRIIIEKLLQEPDQDDLRDFKLMCFNSKVKASFVCSNRYSEDGLKVTFYDTNWQRLPFERHYPADFLEMEKPKSYDEMVELAERLSERIPFVRIDFYEIEGRPYFGEITFYPGSGFEEFIPSQWDKSLGTWINLPEGGGLLICHKTILYVPFKSKNSGNLIDYKFYCFGGVPRILAIVEGINSGKTTASFYDMSLNRIDLEWGYPNTVGDVKYPDSFEEMKVIAEKLSKNLPQARIDLYEVDKKIYFGEITLFDGSGFDRIAPAEWDNKLGKYIDLSNIKT